MKKMVILLLISSSFLLINNSVIKDDISEEVEPVRYNNKIRGINYSINILSSNKNQIKYNTKILDSINHYTDISKLEEIFINLKINNNTKEKYYLKKIIIYNKDKIIKTYNYQNIINNSEIELKLSNDIISKIHNKNRVNGSMEIIIEK